MFEKIESKLSGCFELQPNKFEDERGLFVKTFHEPSFQNMGLCVDFKEEYYSVSAKNVIRGMHFQLPPHDHEKVVYCTSGSVLDVVLDLRKGSSSYGQCISFHLSADKANMVYIPKGMAHGFKALEDHTTMLYKLTTVYAPDSDAGIRWDSFGFDWSLDHPIMSDRDKRLERLKDFILPFNDEVEK